MAASQSVVTTPSKVVAFDELYQAIESDNIALLKAYLTLCDVMLVSEDNYNVLHVVASIGSFKALRVIYDCVDHGLLSMFARSIPDAEGEDLEDFASGNAERLIIPSVAVSVRTDLSRNDLHKMQVTLESLVLSSVTKPMNELVDEKTELANCYGHLDQKSQPYQNLQRVIWTMNEIRKLNLRSYTHPIQEHGFTMAEFNKLQQCKKQAQADYVKEAKDSHRIYPELMKKFAIKHRIANCEERSRMGKLLWKERDTQVYHSMQCYQFRNSDHVFLVLGQDPNCDPNDLLTWGDNAVFCDILNGTFGLAEEIPSLLSGSYHYWSKASNKLVVVHTNFNLNFHQLIPSYEPQPEVTPKRMLAATAAVARAKESKGAIFSSKPKMVSQMFFLSTKKKSKDSKSQPAVTSEVDAKSSLADLATLCLAGGKMIDNSKNKRGL